MTFDSRSFVTAVSGLPRSGTSMMMQMLAAGGIPILTDNLRRPDEDNRRGYYEFEPVKKTKQDSDWLRDAPGKAVKLVYALLYDLPTGYAYRVVFMNRNLHENVASQRVMLARSGKPGATVSDEQMVRIFKDQLAKVTAWLAVQPHFDVLQVDYRRVVDDPEGEARRVSDFLGGEMDIAAMVAAVDPSAYRQRLDSGPTVPRGDAKKGSSGVREQ